MSVRVEGAKLTEWRDLPDDGWHPNVTRFTCDIDRPDIDSHAIYRAAWLVEFDDQAEPCAVCYQCAREIFGVGVS